MGLRPDQLTSSLEPLYEFIGDAIISKGRIRLPLTIGELDLQATAIADFLIIDGPSAYNVIMGRPDMNDLDLVVSTKALTIKFSTPKGTGCVKGEQHSARHCYEEALKIGLKGKKINMVSGGEARVTNGQGISHDLDPCDVDCDRTASPTDELEDVIVSSLNVKRRLQVGKGLSLEVKSQLTKFLKANLDVFAWNHEDMVGIDSRILQHRLNINPNHKPVRQRRKPMMTERYAALKEEVDKLLASRFIREAQYSTWVANLVLVKKKNVKWRTCIDFTDLNKACLKDSFPLPRIDQLVGATADHQLLSSMDAY
ncbi:uncharacterized protein LOC127791555 [Diospyros lotus]|uniref:uncharacterized protein LOC127791555 n=1 Tax=Diospyros lotus TaxID=55363 RepID=UPI00224F8874|nr:uncharacterized protein LOC127791555 [Diospyros lotus]